MFKEFNKQAAKDIREMLTDYISAFEEEHGIEVKFGRIKYSDRTMEIKTEVILKGGKTQLEIEADEMIERHRLNREAIYPLASMQGYKAVLRLVGFRRSARKYPWIAEDTTTKVRYKLSKAQVVEFFRIDR